MLPMEGIEAYRATLRTMAAIEAGGSGDDDADFRRLVAGIASVAQERDATAGRATAVTARGETAAHIAGSIAAAIERLGAAEQIILQLSLVDNCSLAEIGGILDLSPQEIARARRTAIGYLRSDLAAQIAG